MLKEERPPAATNWWHEIERGELYVEFHKTNLITGWWSKWPIEEYRGFAYKHKVMPDIMFTLKDRRTRFPVELDRGTEDWGDLEDKVEKYAGLAQAMPQNPICPIFLLQPGYRNDLAASGRKMVDIIRHAGRKQAFLVGAYSMALDDPTGPIFDDCYTDQPTSILDYE